MNSLGRSWGYYVAEGSLFVILAVIALIRPYIMTLSVDMLLGWLFLFGGVFQAFRTFQTKTAPEFLYSLISSFLLIAAGAIMLANPLKGAITLTWLLALFFFLDGVAKTIWAFKAYENKFWIFLSALIEFALAYIIYSQWPESSAWFIGTLVGAWMLFYGASTISYGLHKRHTTV